MWVVMPKSVAGILKAFKERPEVIVEFVFFTYVQKPVLHFLSKFAQTQIEELEMEEVRLQRLFRYFTMFCDDIGPGLDYESAQALKGSHRDWWPGEDSENSSAPGIAATSFHACFFSILGTRVAIKLTTIGIYDNVTTQYAKTDTIRHFQLITWQPNGYGRALRGFACCITHANIKFQNAKSVSLFDALVLIVGFWSFASAIFGSLAQQINKRSSRLSMNSCHATELPQCHRCYSVR